MHSGGAAMRRSVVVLAKRLRGRTEGVLDLPKEGGSELPGYELNPESVPGRLEERTTGSHAVLGGMPGLKGHFEGGEKVVMKKRDVVPSMEIGPHKMLQHPDVKRAVNKAKRQIETEERWAAHVKAQGEGKGREVPIAQPLYKVLARGGISSGRNCSLIEDGVVRVNGVGIRDRLYMVVPTDNVTIGIHRVLIDFPRMWRFRKDKNDYSLLSAGVNRGTDRNRWHIRGLPMFCYVAGGSPPMKGSGLILFTNDPGLARYIDSSESIERDWVVRVKGDFPVKLLNKLNTNYHYGNKMYRNMEWAVTEIRYAGKYHRRHRDRAVMYSTLKVRMWGPGPPLEPLLKAINKPPISIERLTTGPYNLSYLSGGGAMEAYIDEGLMQFVDHRWAPWIEAHSPLLAKNVTAVLQRKVNLKREGEDGALALIDELEETRTAALEATRKKRRGQHADPPTSVETSLAKHDEEDYMRRKRREIVGKGVPRKAKRSVSDVLADLKHPPIMSGMA